MDLSLVIPTYNEKDNIKILLKNIFKEYKQSKIKGEIIIVDDCSPDGTGAVVEKLKKKNKNLQIIHRKGKLGLSSAVLEGFKIAKSEVLGVMDADLSHPTSKIPEMFEATKDYDLVIGSRYIKGGKILGWGILRKVLSKGATILSRVFTSVKDPMTGYFFVRKECLKDKKLDSEGFKILLDVLIKSDCKKIKEIPITFIDREKGQSKASTKEVFSLLKNLWGYMFYKKEVMKEFFKFTLVGLIGTMVNLIVFYLLIEHFGMYYLVSAIFSFIVAVTGNFLLNKVFTFNEKISYNVGKKYLTFFIVSIMALIVNLIFLYVFTEVFGIYYLISQALAIGVALAINFLGNKIWTFSK